jgi:hypothetical protein
MGMMYAVLVSIVYVIQLGAVIPRRIAGDDTLALFRCCAQYDALTVVDLLGYTLMSVATLIAVPALPRSGWGRFARLAFAANGLLAPVLILQLYFPGLIWIGALWLITFPLAMAFLALRFGEH